MQKFVFANLTLLIAQVLASHGCRQWDMNLIQTADEACWGTGTTAALIANGTIFDKTLNIVLDLTPGMCQNYNIYGTWTSWNWPLPTGTMPVVKMTQDRYPNANNAGLSSALSPVFTCKGTVYIGCIEDWNKPDGWTPTFNTSAYWDFWSTNGSTITYTCDVNPMWGVYSGKAPMDPTLQVCCKLDSSNMCTDWQFFSSDKNAFWKNCYCQFDNDMCDFDHWGTGVDQAQTKPYIATDMDGTRLTLLNPNSYAGAIMKVCQDNAFRKLVNFTAFTKMGFGVSFRTEVVVCGEETITCPAASCTYLYQSLQNPVAFTYTTAQMNASFLITYPSANVLAPLDTFDYEWNPLPTGRQSCNVKNVILCKTCGIDSSLNCASPYVNPRITLGAKNALGYPELIIDRNGAMYETFQYLTYTRGRKFACKQVTVEICGFETVTSTLGYDPEFPNVGGNSPYILNTGEQVPGIRVDRGWNGAGGALVWTTNSTNQFCNIVKYEVLMDDPMNPGQYIASDLAYFNNAGDTLLRIKTNIRGTVPFKEKIYIRATTQSGQSGLQTYYLYICGGEVVTCQTLAAKPYFVLWFGQNAGTSVFPSHSNVNSNFTVNNTQCPIVNYYIEEETTPAGTFINFQSALPLANNKVYVNNQGCPNCAHSVIINTLSSQPPPFTYNQYTLFVTAITASGKLARCPMGVKVCGSETFVSNLTTSFYPYEYQSGAKFINLKYYYTTNDSECPIMSYSLTQVDATNSSCTSTPYKNDISLTYLPANSFLIQTNTNNPQFETFCIKIQTVTNHALKDIYIYKKITVKVCGNEDIQSTITVPLTVWVQDGNPVLYQNWSVFTGSVVTQDVRNWFKNNDSIDCPIISYELFDTNFRIPQNEKDMVFLSSSSPANMIQLMTVSKRNLLKDFVVVAKTKANRWAYQVFTVHICGYEMVSVKEARYVYDQYDGVAYQKKENFSSLLNNSDPVICPYQTTEWLYKDQFGNYKPYTEGLVEANISLFQFNTYTTWTGYRQLYLKVTTIGNQSNILPVRVDICGGDAIKFKAGPSKVNVTYLQETGIKFIQTARQLLLLVTTNAEYCPIVWSKTKLMLKNQYTGQLEEYTNYTRVRLDKMSPQAYINTTEVYHLELFLVLWTRNSNPFYLPFEVEILPKSTEVFNQPPYFQVAYADQLNYTLRQDNETYRFYFNLTKQLDDWNNITWMNITSKTFGKLKIRYTYPEQANFENSRIYDMLTFNNLTNQLVLSIQGGPLALSKYCGAVYAISAVLIDHKGLQTEKILTLNLTLDSEWYRLWLIDHNKVDTLKIIKPPVGKIQYISVFGEVTIKLNQSSTFRAQNLTKEQCKTFDQKLIQIYVRDIYDWHEWRNQEIKTLNFTWELREFNEKFIRIKLNFSDPTAVSPFPRYDILTIYFKELSSLFNNYEKRRQLNHQEFRVVLEKSIQKQMHDTAFGRQMVVKIYQVRWALIGLLLGTLAFSILFRPPYDREYLMILELQLMCNLAIFHVTLPGNVEISMTIMKHFASLNVAKWWSFDDFGLETSEDDSEKKLESLGQRATYNYDTFNFMFNLKTIGIIFFLYLLKVLFLGLLYCFKQSFKRHKHAHITQLYYQRWFHQALYQDLLRIYTYGFLELTISCFISITATSQQVDFTFANLSLTSIAAILLFFGIPFVYLLIFMKAKELTADQFRSKFGHHFMGAKVRIYSKDSISNTFNQVYWFLGIRTFFVWMSFFTSLGWLQIMLLAYLFLASTARVVAKKPYEGKWHNRLRVFNQISVLVCIYHMICFTDYVEREPQYLMGFSFLIWVAFFILVNQLQVLLDLLSYIYYLILLYCPKFADFWWEIYLQFRGKWWLVKAFFKWLLDVCLFYLFTAFAYLKLNLILFISWILRLCRKTKTLAPEEPEPELVPQIPVYVESSRPETPTVKTLKLVKGIWTQVYVKVSEQQNLNGKDFLQNDPWKKTAQLIKDRADTNFTLAKQVTLENKDVSRKVSMDDQPQENYANFDHLISKTPTHEDTVTPVNIINKKKELTLVREEISLEAQSDITDERVELALIKVEKPKVEEPSLKLKKKKIKKKVKKAQKVKPTVWNDLIVYTQEEVAPALFHDPGLFFNDADKDRGKDALTQWQKIGANGQTITHTVEKNPLFDKTAIKKEKKKD